MGRFAHILSICGAIFLAGIGGPGEVRADASLVVLDEINALRRQHGLAPVRLEPRLTVEARAHARDMARHDYLDTRLPSGEQLGRLPGPERHVPLGPADADAGACPASLQPSLQPSLQLSL